MAKKLVIGGLVLIVLAAGALYFRARAIFSSDIVRTGIEAQLSRALGQPVAIGSIGATIFPRVTMVLSDVGIGSPARIRIARLDVGASTRALLSRRIEDATLLVDQAQLELPLPPFAIGSGGDEASSGGDAVTIASIREINLNDVRITSGGRTLRGDVRVLPSGAGLRIADMALDLDGTTIEVTGDIAGLDGPQGALTLRAETLDMLALQAFAADFAGGAGLADADAAEASAPAAASLRLDVALDAGRAGFGTLALADVRGNATLTADRLEIRDMTFAVFEGRYRGSLDLGLTDTPAFHLRGDLDGVNLATLTAWAGQPDAISGTLAGRLDATGAGTDADAVLGSARGSARLDLTDGTVKGLELVRTIVVASSMRTDSMAAAAAGGGSEAFSRLGGTFIIADGRARTDDLAFESSDVSMSAAGHFRLDATDVDLTGRVQLSEALTAQAGRDLVRYTQEGGRVTVPVRISGSAGALSVELQTADLLRRAVTNKAVEEAGEALRRGLGGLLGR